MEWSPVQSAPGGPRLHPSVSADDAGVFIWAGSGLTTPPSRTDSFLRWRSLRPSHQQLASYLTVSSATTILSDDALDGRAVARFRRPAHLRWRSSLTLSRFDPAAGADPAVPGRAPPPKRGVP